MSSTPGFRSGSGLINAVLGQLRNFDAWQSTGGLAARRNRSPMAKLTAIGNATRGLQLSDVAFGCSGSIWSDDLSSSAPAHEAGALLREVGFRTTAFDLGTRGFAQTTLI